jgi:hypothetical protein
VNSAGLGNRNDPKLWGLAEGRTSDETQEQSETEDARESAMHWYAAK